MAPQQPSKNRPLVTVGSHCLPSLKTLIERNSTELYPIEIPDRAINGLIKVGDIVKCLEEHG